ncbi:MAG TPA: tripartite tricarboxylate transporter substrate binding protein [Burkholderiales bacterium]|jgi:tripartite-type tricarboxylate transporter receptor subunit TctC|nr:tripartite tricarboxylate transporter substrate binding protein [Burkholderiales bacterium]
MRALFAVFLLVFSLNSNAQNWPSKPMRYIVPFPPGAFNDTLGRTISAELSKTLGQPVVVDNRPGANSIIGTEAAAKSAPDGYTIFGAALPFSAIQSLFKTSFDVTRDFAPITLAGFSANLMVANPNFKAGTVKELIDYARSNPGRINYGSSGNGTSVHLAMELFKSMTKTYMLHIPYKGSAPVVADLIAGQVDLMFDNMPNVIGHVRAGRMKALAVSTAQRSPLAPEIPTVAEAGVPGYEQQVWFGVLAPAGTPRDIIARLNTEIVRILNSREVKERFGKQGVEVRTTSPDEFSVFLRSEVTRWAKVIKDSGIKAD